VSPAVTNTGDGVQLAVAGRHATSVTLLFTSRRAGQPRVTMCAMRRARCPGERLQCHKRDVHIATHRECHRGNADLHGGGTDSGHELPV